MIAQTAPGPIFGLQRGATWFLVAGILFIVVGALALVEPLVTSVAVGLFLGVSFLFAGAMAAGTGIANIGHKGGWLYVLLGVFGMVAGGFMALQPVAAAVSLVWITGFFLIFAGAFELAAAFRAEKHRGWMVFLGAADILLGVLLLDIDPLAAVHFLAFIVAVSFVMRGVASIVLSTHLRKLSQA